MSLATRCPACQTVFRVVQDQLRVSEGWVRCGRCAEVFNALEHMVEVAKPAVPAAASAAPGTPDLSDARPMAAGLPETGAAVAGASASEPAGAAAPENDVVAGPAPFHEDPLAAQLPHEAELAVALQLPPGVVAAHEEQTMFVTGESAPAAVVADTVALLELRPGATERDAPDAPGIDDAARPDAGPSTITETEPEPPSAPPPDSEPAAEALPSFLRQAQRAERWRAPGVRAGLLAVLLLALAGLALQVSLTYRDLIAARWTDSLAWLEPLCQAFGCRIEQPRWLDAVVVESTGLTRNEGTATYRLQVVLRNRSAMTLALPWIDLSLTDTQGRLVARRAISARELGSPAPALPAQGELTLQATLGVHDRSGAAIAAGPGIAGYTIEIFYP